MRQKETNMTNTTNASFTHLETMNVLTSTLPNDLFQEITGDIADLSKDSEPYNDRLIGHITAPKITSKSFILKACGLTSNVNTNLIQYIIIQAI